MDNADEEAGRATRGEEKRQGNDDAGVQGEPAKGTRTESNGGGEEEEGEAGEKVAETVGRGAQTGGSLIRGMSSSST